MQEKMVGRYESLIWPLSLLILLGLYVSVFHYYNDKNIDKQTDKLYLAVMQKELSQQLVNSAVAINSQTAADDALIAFQTIYRQFGVTHDALLKGGTVNTVVQTNPAVTHVEADNGPEGNLIMHDLDQVWQTIDTELSSLQLVDPTQQTPNIEFSVDALLQEKADFVRLTGELVNHYKQRAIQGAKWADIVNIVSVVLVAILLLTIIRCLLKLKRTCFTEYVTEQTSHYPDSLEITSPQTPLNLVIKSSDITSGLSGHFSQQTNTLNAIDEFETGPSQSLLDLPAVAKKIAAKYDKVVELKLTGFAEPVSASVSSTLRNVIIQFIRNSVMHSIETPAERVALMKPHAGLISIALSQSADNSHILSYEDDGQGVNFSRIRQCLVEQGHYTVQQVNTMSQQDLILSLFNTGFSTVEETTQLSGQGLGLSLAIQLVRQIDGRLNVRLNRSAKLVFSIEFNDGESMLHPVAV